MKETPDTGISCKVIDHTADTGIRASAPTIEALFQVCALGMMEIIMEGSSCKEEKPVIKYPITIKGNDKEDLLYAFLSEILYLFDGESIIPLGFKSSKLENCIFFSTTLEGIHFDEKIHDIGTEIKAITFHNLKIEKIENRWQTDVIFDI